MISNYQSVTDFRQEVARRELAKEDYIVSQNAILMDFNDGSLNFQEKHYPLTDYSHKQLADRLQIPRKYYEMIDRIAGLRAFNVNQLLMHEERKKFMLRTLDDKVRAVLSERFKPFDNAFVLQPLFEVLEEFPHSTIKTQVLTDLKMFIQVIFPGITADVRPGDPIQCGITIVNSETGSAAFDIKQLIWRQICSNGAVASSVMRRYHVGRRVGNDESDYTIFKDDTIAAELHSFKLRIRDVLSHTLTQDSFNEVVAQYRQAADDKFDKPKVVIENVTKRFNFTETQADKTFGNLISGADMTRYGLSNAITAMAKEVDNRDRQYEIERHGFDIINMTANEWGKMVKADEE